MGQSAGLNRCNVPPAVSALYIQIREAHTRDGWHIGGPLVADRQHANLQERQSACMMRPKALRWMTPLSDAMSNVFSDAYGAWPTAFFIFEKQDAVEDDLDHLSCQRQMRWRLIYRSRPTHEAHIDVCEVLNRLWGSSDRRNLTHQPECQ